MGKTGIFQKNLEHFCHAYKPYLTANFQKKVMKGFRETAWHTNGWTNGRDSLGLQRLRRETKKFLMSNFCPLIWPKKMFLLLKIDFGHFLLSCLPF